MIPDAAVASAARAFYGAAWDDYSPEDLKYALDQIRASLEAAAPHMLAGAWQSAYDQGVDDERTSQANPGIAGCFCHTSPCQCFIAPARVNPYEVTP